MKFLSRDSTHVDPYKQLNGANGLFFSEQTKKQQNWLIGRWCVTGHIWSGSREWARSPNRIGKLASFSNAECIHAHEKTSQMESDKPHWRMFYKVERTSNTPEPRITAWPGPG